jgi:hypothetical protein
MKISAYFIVTEPEKMGYPYLESIHAALSFCHEIVVVCGRKEQVSEDKIKQIGGPYVKIINTDAWPVDWKYHSMGDHLQIGLDNCSGDICLKIDADCVFRPEKKAELMAAFSNPKVHRINIGRINYYAKNIFLPRRTTVIYALNKTLIKQEGWTAKISYLRDNMSNQPFFYNAQNNSVDNQIKTKYIENIDIWPVNYDGTFMNEQQIAHNQMAMHYARHGIRIDEETALSDSVRHKRKRLWDTEEERHKWSQPSLTQRWGYAANFHPPLMNDRLARITPEMWGYDCFGLIP